VKIRESNSVIHYQAEEFDRADSKAYTVLCGGFEDDDPDLSHFGLYVDWDFIFSHAERFTDDNEWWPDAYLCFSLDDLIDDVIDGREGEPGKIVDEDGGVAKLVVALRAAADRLEATIVQ
jgi:hypothetical protein